MFNHRWIGGGVLACISRGPGHVHGKEASVKKTPCISITVTIEHSPFHVYSSTMLPFSLTYRPSKNFRISLFRTLQICWISAADCETASRLLPESSS